jgi:hypothetical protein
MQACVEAGFAGLRAVLHTCAEFRSSYDMFFGLVNRMA